MTNPEDQALTALAKEAEDARMGHVRLDETSARGVKGSLYERLSWLIQMLSDENGVQRNLKQAADNRADIFAKQVAVAKHERTAAYYQQRILETEKLALLADRDADKIVLAEERQINADNRRQIRGLQARNTQLKADRDALKEQLEKVKAERDALADAMNPQDVSDALMRLGHD